ncbi:GyrI-like domain-containing protein [Paenibacillus sp. GCM10012306]|uniref:AraC family transcriptional regulator n=1 Tax=Paenibacillus sp. GCM10012306 TaxID=3317342 RepID=UPI00360AB643
MKSPNIHEMTIYTRQVNAVLDYIHTNLDDDLSLERLAEVAGFSPYHFHRMFKHVVKETLNKYVNRVRIEKASKLLVFHENMSLTEIGLECGFSSSAGFSRSFKIFYGMSPTNYRLQFNIFKPRSVTFAEKHFRHKMQVAGYLSIDIDETIRWAHHYVHTAQIVHFPPVKVFSIRHSGLSDTGLTPELSHAFDKAFRQAHHNGLLSSEPEIIGVSYDDPYMVPLEKCRYDACVTVTPHSESRDDLEIATLPGGKYAVIEIRGSIHLLWLLSGLLAQSWLPQSGYVLDNRPIIEKHFHNPRTDPERHFRSQWCLPIRGK